jgi:hypothetical protein
MVQEREDKAIQEEKISVIFARKYIHI